MIKLKRKDGNCRYLLDAIIIKFALFRCRILGFMLIIASLTD